MNMLSSFATFMQEGGSLMYYISIVFILGLGVCVERLIRYSQYNVNASAFMNEIQKLILAHKIKEAIQYCSGTSALLPRVIKSALKRSNQGMEQIQNAIDAGALEVIPLVEKRMHWVSLTANISTLLGLLGTIFGLIDSFKAVEVADPSKKAEILSSGISVAMNTTALGLISAIILMVFHAWLVSNSEKIISDIDQYAVKTLDTLGTLKISNNMNIDE